MVKRRYADYLTGVERGPAHPETEPRRDGTGGEPSARAWLQRAETDDPDHPHGRPVEPGEEWMMTLELHDGATNHAGTFKGLVGLAVDAGIDEFHVWSSTRHDFEVFTANTVRPLK